MINEKKINRSELLTQLTRNWPSPIVAREKVGEFSGGVLNPRTLCNADSLGIGPRERIKIGKKVAYPVKSLVDWMLEKTKGEDNA